jgi:hypothetical protein
VIGASIRAKPGTNAAVIYLHIKTFFIVISSIDRTNWLTGRIATLLTHNRNKASLYVWVFTFPVSLDSNPLNRTTLIEMFFQIVWDIILRLARNDATVAPSAPVDVNHHPPFSILAISHLFAPALKSSSVRISASERPR